jgi:hypothetical protein
MKLCCPQGPWMFIDQVIQIPGLPKLGLRFVECYELIVLGLVFTYKLRINLNYDIRKISYIKIPDKTLNGG